MARVLALLALERVERCRLGWIIAAVVIVLTGVMTLGAAEQTRPITLVAVQMQVRLDDYQSPAAFGAEVQRYMKAALRTPGDGPRLVAFPEDVGLGLVLIDDYQSVKDCTSWGEAASMLIGLYWPDICDIMVQYGCSPMRALLLLKGERVREVYTDTFSTAAKEHHVTLVAGSAPIRDAQGNVFNTSYVFGPTGKLIGSQHKVYLIDLEGPAGLDLTPAPLSDIHALDTPAGRIGIGICYDMFFPDLVEQLVAEGSQILVQPTFNPQPWDAWQQKDWKRGLWTAVATHPTVTAGVNPMMVGSLWNVGVEGVSSVIGGSFDPPAEGYLAEAASATEEDTVFAEVALPK